jgi:hypothetical protein
MICSLKEGMMLPAGSSPTAIWTGSEGVSMEVTLLEVLPPLEKNCCQRINPPIARNTKGTTRMRIFLFMQHQRSTEKVAFDRLLDSLR